MFIYIYIYVCTYSTCTQFIPQGSQSAQMYYITLHYSYYITLPWYFATCTAYMYKRMHTCTHSWTVLYSRLVSGCNVVLQCQQVILNLKHSTLTCYKSYYGNRCCFSHNDNTHIHTHSTMCAYMYVPTHTQYVQSK